MDSATLLESLPMRFPARTVGPNMERRGLLEIPFATVRTIKRDLFVRIPKHVNSFLKLRSDTDLLDDSFSVFRSSVISYV